MPTQFRERYFDPDQRTRDVVYSYKPKDGADSAIRQLIGDICVSMKAEDYIILPDCTKVRGAFATAGEIPHSHSIREAYIYAVDTVLVEIKRITGEELFHD